MSESIKSHNFIIPNGDTDSISFCKPDFGAMTETEIKELIVEMNDMSPDFMDWEDDGYYKCVIVLKAKNYILLKTNKKTGQDEIILKGSGLKDAKKEPALKEMMNEIIDGLLYEKNNTLEVYHKYVKEAANIQDISRWAVKKSISKKLLEGTRKNETDVLAAIPDLSQVREGDKIFIYKALDGERQIMEKDKETGELVPAFYKAGKKKGQPKMEPNSYIKQVQFYNNDADTAHYYGRVFATLSIFENVLDISTFIDYSKPKNKELLP